MGEEIQFEVARDRLTKFRTAFSLSLSGLRDCAVPLAQFGPLILAALQLSPPQREEPFPSEVADWQHLGSHIDEMSNRYADELGENAYAAFNAITEFASRPPVNRSIHRDRNSFQKLAGSWLTSFNEYCREPSFTISSYIERLENEQANGIPMTPAQVRADHRQVEELDH